MAQADLRKESPAAPAPAPSDMASPQDISIRDAPCLRASGDLGPATPGLRKGGSPRRPDDAFSGGNGCGNGLLVFRGPARARCVRQLLVGVWARGVPGRIQCARMGDVSCAMCRCPPPARRHFRRLCGLGRGQAAYLYAGRPGRTLSHPPHCGRRFTGAPLRPPLRPRLVPRRRPRCPRFERPRTALGR